MSLSSVVEISMLQKFLIEKVFNKHLTLAGSLRVLL